MRKPNAKERILETASQLFHERGYSEVGINEIIEKAETAKASFYQHFSSKEGLCEAWLQNVHDRSEGARSELLEADCSPVEKIRIYFERMERIMKESNFRGCPYSNTGAVSGEECGGIRKQIEDHKQSLRDFFRALCEQQNPGGEENSSVGDQIFVLFSGAATEAQNLRDLWPVREACKAAITLISQ
ncbi:MAG: TetR/AcrR family transcriptional regulator [Verrucomicrobiales bacterium]|nr:TetR/AcrR family transcriptional regulator [Verrucomicrobiales bacterium]